MTTQKYIPIWKKYRPAVLKLMVDAVDGPQEYAFSDHEFKDINPKQKGGYSFVMRIHKSRAISDIKDSAVANDLLGILQQSDKAIELTEAAIYEFILDKTYVLHIKREELPEEEKPEEELTEKDQ